MWLLTSELSQEWKSLQKFGAFLSYFVLKKMQILGACLHFFKNIKEFGTFYVLFCHCPGFFVLILESLYLIIWRRFGGKKHRISVLFPEIPQIWEISRISGAGDSSAWHVTNDTQGAGNIVLKFQGPSSHGWEVMMFWELGGRGSLTEWMNQRVTKVFVEQPGYIGSVN